jgi:phage shock protein PspC (stress-responsive transcriptional regulator)
MFILQYRKQDNQFHSMNLVDQIKEFFERQAFGVCTAIGERLQMRTSVIRLFFIYTSFLTIGSPIIIYMILAFWIKMKSYVKNRRTSVWDL